MSDALVTRTPGLVLTILTADCQPVLFSDREAVVIGGAHAGWRGALDGVLENTIKAMEKLGARRTNISAAIGPSISQNAYEVGPEFFEGFVSKAPGSRRFFEKGKEDRYQFDLSAYGIDRLQKAGIKQAEWTGHCTYHDATRFYSYRRSVHEKAADYGRLISMIRL